MKVSLFLLYWETMWVEFRKLFIKVFLPHSLLFTDEMTDIDIYRCNLKIKFYCVPMGLYKLLLCF